jgi:hypothetical protein
LEWTDQGTYLDVVYQAHNVNAAGDDSAWWQHRWQAGGRVGRFPVRDADGVRRPVSATDRLTGRVSQPNMVDLW